MKIKVRCTRTMEFEDSCNKVIYVKGKVYDIDYVTLHDEYNENFFLVSKDHAMTPHKFFNSFEEVEVSYVAQYSVINNNDWLCNDIVIFDTEYECKRYMDECINKTINILDELNISQEELFDEVDEFITEYPFTININNCHIKACYHEVFKPVK